MPQLIRLYISQVAIGFAIAAFVVSTLLFYDVANLRHLVMQSDRGFMAVILLWVFNGIVFGSVQFAIRIMFMAENADDEDEDSGDWASEPVALRIDR